MELIALTVLAWALALVLVTYPFGLKVVAAAVTAIRQAVSFVRS